MALKVAEDVLEEEDDVTETEAAAAEEPREMTEEDLQREAELLTKLSAQQIRLILADVCTEMLSGLEVFVVLHFNTVLYGVGLRYCTAVLWCLLLCCVTLYCCETKIRRKICATLTLGVKVSRRGSVVQAIEEYIVCREAFMSHW